MTTTRDHRGTGALTFRCDSCGKTANYADGWLVSAASAHAAGRGWRITRAKDTCPACTRKADAATKPKARAKR